MEIRPWYETDIITFPCLNSLNSNLFEQHAILTKMQSSINLKGNKFPPKKHIWTKWNTRITMLMICSMLMHLICVSDVMTALLNKKLGNNLKQFFDLGFIDNQVLVQISHKYHLHILPVSQTNLINVQLQQNN